MKTILSMTVALATLSSAAWAGAVKATDEGGTVIKLTENKKYDVAVSERLRVVIEDEKVDTVLKLSGYATRHNILGASYVVRSYITDGSTLTEDKALEELKAMPVRALRLNIVFPLKAAMLRDKFAEALKDNGIDAKKDVAIKALMDQLTFNVSPGDTIDFISATRSDGTDTVSIVLSTQAKPLQGSDAELGLKFWKIWFGKTQDADMAKVRKALIKG